MNNMTNRFLLLIISVTLLFTSAASAQRPIVKRQTKTVSAIAPKNIANPNKKGVKAIAAEKENNIQINGIIIGLKGDSVALMDGMQNTILAKVKGEGNMFSLKANAKIGDGRLYQLAILPTEPVGEIAPPATFIFIDNPELKITAEITNNILNIISETPSPSMDEYLKLKKQNSAEQSYRNLQSEYQQNITDYNNSPVDYTEKLNKIQKNFNNLDGIKKEVFNKYIEMIPANQTSDALLALIFQNNNAKTSEESEQWLNKFDPSMKNRFYGRYITKRANYEKNSKIGMIAPDFSLYDQNGKLLKLSKLRGQYVLLSFWNVWSNFSNVEMPRLIDIANKYGDKIKVVGICLYSTKDIWLNKLNELNSNYTQLIDEGNVTPIRYNFGSAPFIILINPQGEIVKRGLRGENITKVIENLGL